MSEIPKTAATSRLGPWLAAFVKAVLLASTLIYQGYHAFIAFDRNDTNHLETPLLLATERQLADGPATLYGPFSGSDPLVLIHAPLYYRLSAAIAWPIWRAGVDPRIACLIATRSLAFVGLVVTALAAAGIARRDGPPAPVGLWAALLIASSPVFGSFGFTVRPDTLGLAFQTLGAALAIRAIDEGPSARAWRLLLSGLCFGLAPCAKQNLLIPAAILALMLLAGVARGRLPRLATLAALGLGVAVPVAYYAWEQSVTGGRMAQAVFGVPARMREVAPGSRGYLLTVLWTTAKLSAGEGALFLTMLLGGGRGSRGNWRDVVVGAFFVAESAAMVVLVLGSEGGWVNYAMPSVVWGSILLARALGRRLSNPGLPARSVLVALGALLLLAADLRLVAISYANRHGDARALASVLGDPVVASTPADRLYFVALPQDNRLYGRVALAHDEWLYDKFERLGLVQPREEWVRSALTEPGGVEVVVVPSDVVVAADRVPGVSTPLPDLGYRIHQQYGSFAIWTRGPRR